MYKPTLIKKGVPYVLYKLFYQLKFYELFKEKNIISKNFPEITNAMYPYIMKGVAAPFNDELFPSEEINKVLKEAEDICSHKFKIFDKTFQFGKEINWHIAENGNLWPVKKWYQIKLDNNKFGDVKYTWELNRHQHLMILGRAYYYTKNEKFAVEFKNEVMQWIKSNPVEYGINWSSGLEIALRAISWTVSMDFFYKSPLIDKSFLNNFLQTLWSFGSHIYQNLFYTEHLMNNNHLIGEATALLFISLYFNRKSESEKWFKKAMEILKKESIRQFNKDGTSIENSSSYEVFSLYFLLLDMLVLEKNGISVPSEIYSAIEKGTNFTQYLIKPDGELAKYGDCDEAKVLLLSNNSQVADVLNLASVIFNRADFKYSISENIFPENVFFLLGNDGLKKWNNLKPLKTYGRARYFPNGQIGIVRDNNNSLLVKLGNIEGHSHADIGHFLLSLAKEEVIIDSGTYKYNYNANWRKYFRSSEAHNTLMIDGIEQAKPIRKFNWESVYKVLSTSFDVKDDKIVKFQTVCKVPFRNTKFSYARTFLYHFQRNMLIVIDEIKGKDKHSIELNFHLSPFVKIINISNNIVALSFSKDKRLIIVSRNVSDKISSPKVNITKGWFSPFYGVKTKAPVISVKYNYLDLPARIITMFYWGNEVLDSSGVDFGDLLDRDDVVDVRKMVESVQGGA